MWFNDITKNRCEVCLWNKCERCTPIKCCECNKDVIAHELKHISWKPVPMCDECIDNLS